MSYLILLCVNQNMEENSTQPVNYRDLLNKAILQSDILKIFDYLLTI